LWLLAELFEQLPEVGDLDKPKLVFFFDEAHLLFDGATKALQDKVELVVRLIRSKGVGVYFVTQNPIDIPEKVLGQLGNRIQHAIRAYTPKEQKAIVAMSQTFRQNPDIDIPAVMTDLKTGEALVSMLDEEGRPNMVQRALIAPPHSKFGVLDAIKRNDLIQNSPYYYKYHQIVDKESAYEMLRAQMVVKQTAEKQAADEIRQKKEELALEKERIRLEKERERLDRSKKTTARTSQSEVTKMAKSFMGTMSSSVGREIARGIFNTLIKGK
jgi:DNA helicase HerA-like ATPase